VVTFTLNGLMKTKAATDDLWVTAAPTAANAQDPLKPCLATALPAGVQFVQWCWLDASGTASVTYSDVRPASTILAANWPTFGRYVPGAFELPERTDQCLVGALHLLTTAAYTIATTAIGTNSTATYYNIGVDLSTPITY
jgi:hypothetical protein